MFQVLEKLGIPSPFIHMIRLQYQDTIVFQKINNQVTKPFAIHRGIYQGCPFAPYLFIIVVEALNDVIKNAMRISLIKGISLSQCTS